MIGSLVLALVALRLTDDNHHVTVAALSYAGRPRRSPKSNDLASSSSSSVASSSSASVTSPQLLSQEQQLIRDEEAARIKRIGQVKRRREKHARMEDRISYLESLASTGLTDVQQKELEGLLRTRDSFEEQYDPTAFSSEHVAFKKMHNDAFVALARYCHNDRVQRGGDKDGACNVFYLDGPDGATTLALQNDGFDPSCCYVANRHLDTCEILREHHNLPEENVLHCTAAEALTPFDSTMMCGESGGDAWEDNMTFADVDFAAYYFDGCGGFVPHIVGMMAAALIRTPLIHQQQRKTTAVGFSLMGGNRDVIHKELEVCQALSVIARTKGMRTRHVLDDPGRYGIPVEIAKAEGGTFTSWIILEED